MRWDAVHEVQIAGKKIEPQQPLLDTLIVTRQLVEEYDLFHKKISIGRAKSLPIADKQNLTTIEVLYDTLDIHLRDGGGSRSWKRFKAIRPSDDVIARFYKRATELWDTMIQHFPPLQELRESKPTEEIS